MKKCSRENDCFSSPVFDTNEITTQSGILNPINLTKFHASENVGNITVYFHPDINNIEGIGSIDEKKIANASGKQIDIELAVKIGETIPRPNFDKRIEICINAYNTYCSKLNIIFSENDNPKSDDEVQKINNSRAIVIIDKGKANKLGSAPAATIGGANSEPDFIYRIEPYNNIFYFVEKYSDGTSKNSKITIPINWYNTADFNTALAKAITDSQNRGPLMYYKLSA